MIVLFQIVMRGVNLQSEIFNCKSYNQFNRAKDNIFEVANMILLGLSLVAIIIIALIVLLIIALVLVVRKLKKQVKNVAQVVEQKLNKSQIMLKNKSEFLIFLRKVSAQFLKVIQQMNAKLITDELLNKQSTSELLQSIQKIKGIFKCIHHQGIQNLLSERPVGIPPILGEILSQKVKLICKEQQLDQFSLLQCFVFYEGDKNVEKARQQFEHKVQAIVNRRIKQYLPPVPQQLTKQKLMEISKLRIIKNYETNVNQSKIKLSSSQIRSLQKTIQPQENEKQIDNEVLSLLMSDNGVKQDQNIGTLGTFNSAICRHWNDEQFLDEYRNFEAKTKQIKKKYEKDFQVEQNLKELMKTVKNDAI